MVCINAAESKGVTSEVAKCIALAFNDTEMFSNVSIKWLRLSGN